MEKKKNTERPVLVTTANRGIFFGYATETTGDIIELKRGRNCAYWSASMRGFVGLAAIGPDAQCRVGPEADMQLRNITAVLAVTPEAEARWRAARWA